MVKHRNKALLTFFLLSICLVRAQTYPNIKRANNWYFGYYAGLDFSSGFPIAANNGQLYSVEACASMSDTAGNLLLYTDGITVWNKNHLVMQNGNGLLGCQSSTQGALIIPMPGSDSLYYIFTTDCAENNFLNGFRYSIVDISLNSGLGGVIQKNVFLHDSIGEKLCGVNNYNQHDIWIVVHQINSNMFLSYPLTNLGVGSPVISNVGMIPSGYGDIKISPNGDKLVQVTYGNFPPLPSVELFEYNDTNGIVSNLIFSDTSEYYLDAYGAEFSPDNSKLYIGSGILTQYDLSQSTPQNILNSRVLFAGVGCSGLQLASDGGIYFHSSEQVSDSVSVISSPNMAGASCNIIKNCIYLNGGQCTASFPGFIESYFNNIPQTLNTRSIEVEDHAIKVFPNPFNYFCRVVMPSASNGYDVEICNAIGLKVKSFKEYKNSFPISGEDLIDGIYFLKISYDNKTITHKLIINH